MRCVIGQCAPEKGLERSQAIFSPSSLPTEQGISPENSECRGFPDEVPIRI
jgi:hypothetical protein